MEERMKPGPKPKVTLEQSTISRLIESGIPVHKAEFQSAVNNSDGVPENQFSEASQNASRRVEMWWTSCGLICLHKDKYFVTPHANVKHAHFK